MGWQIKNGSYPYLSGLTETPMGCFANAEHLQIVKFKGTAAQWEKIERGAQWRENAPFERVICTDGTMQV